MEITTKTIRFYLNLNNFFCLFPFHITQQISHGSAQFHFNGLFYLIKATVFLIAFLVCQYTVCYARTMDFSLQEIVFNCCSFYTTFTILCVNLNCLKIRKELEGFLLKYEALRKVLEVYQHRDEFSKNVLLCETVYLVATWSYMLVVYSYFYDFTSGMLFLFGFTLPKFLVILAGFTFVHFVLLLRRQFHNLNNRLENLSVLDDKILEELPKIYFKLVRLSKKINKLYGYQNLVILSKFYVWVVFEMYHFFLLASQDQIPWNDVKLMIFGATWSAIQLSAAAGLLLVCSNAKSEANRFGALWSNALLRKNVRGKVSVSFKLATEVVRFSTNDWFDMDFLLLFEMVGSISTFIVILTQFSTKFISNNY